MTMVSSGPISIGGSATTAGLNQSINVELGLSPTATTSLNQANVRSLAGIASGQISLSNFYGKSTAQYLGIAQTSTLTLVYPVTSAGVGTPFSPPAGTVSSTWCGIAFHPNLQAVVFRFGATSSTLFRTALFSPAGYTSSISASVAPSPQGDGRNVNWRPQGDSFFGSYSATPFDIAYQWTGTDIGTRFTAPSVVGLGGGLQSDVSSSGLSFVAGGTTTPFFWGRSITGTSFGTRFSSPPTIPSDRLQGIAITKARTAIVGANRSSPFSYACAYNEATGFGTAFAGPATAVPGAGQYVSTATNNALVGISHTASPYFSVYNWSNTTGWGTKLANPSSIPSWFSSTTITFSKNIDWVAATSITSSATAPYVRVYAFSPTTGFGTLQATPAGVITTNDARGSNWSL